MNLPSHLHAGETRMSSPSRGASIRTLKAKMFWLRSRESVTFLKWQMTSSCQFLPVPRLDTHQEDPGTNTTQQLRPKTSMFNWPAQNLIFTRSPTAPGRPTGPLFPLAPCGKSSPPNFSDCSEVSDAGIYTEGRMCALTGVPTFPSSPGRPSVPGIPC